MSPLVETHGTFPPADPAPELLPKIITTTATYAPALLAGIIAVEQTVGSLPGETKAQIAVATTAAGLQAAGQLLPPGHVQDFFSLASMLVAILNASGLFKKKAVTV